MKNKIISISFIVIIFGMFSLNILTNNTKELISSSISEVKSGNYSTTTEKISQLVKSLENTYNDHIALKKELGVPTNLIDFKLFNRVDSNATLLGKNKWLFYKATYDGKSIDDYQGINLYSEEQMATIAQNFEEAKKYYADKGIEFHLMICPNKEQIYSKYMPPDISVATQEKKADRLIKYLKERNIPVIDPKAELLEYKDKAQLYYQNDTHWNNLGAFIAAQQINEVILGTRETFDPSRVYSEGKANKCDLLTAIGLPAFNYDKEYNYKSDVSNIDVTYTTVNDYRESFTSNGASDKKVLFIGDSFRWALENWLPNYYSKVDFMHRDHYTKKDVEEIQPEVIIFEVVERHTDALLGPLY